MSQSAHATVLTTEKCRSGMPASVTHVNTSLGTVAKLLTTLAFMTRQGCHRASCLPHKTTKLATALTTAPSLYQNLQLTMPINPSILSSLVSSSRRRDSRMWHLSFRSVSLPGLTASCTHKYRMSTCLTLPIPSRLASMMGQTC